MVIQGDLWENSPVVQHAQILQFILALCNPQNHPSKMATLAIDTILESGLLIMDQNMMPIFFYNATTRPQITSITRIRDCVSWTIFVYSFVLI